MQNNIISEIYRQNSHWQNVQSFLFDLENITYKRYLFDILINNLDNRQILSIIGLRRVGKTVLLKQIIKHLLDFVVPTNIFFLTFDEALLSPKIGITDYINYYFENIANRQQRVYVILDEIQYSNNWQHILKRYYDTEKNIKFIISGSSSLFLKKKTTESLVGRISEYTLHILSFLEYLQLIGGNQDLINDYQQNLIKINNISHIENVKSLQHFIILHQKELIGYFEEYLKYGQFPELLKINDIQNKKKYLSESIYKKTIEYDIPRIFSTQKDSELKFLFQILINELGQIAQISNLSQEIGIDQKTLIKYLNYFQLSFLLDILYNYSKSFRKGKKSLKKIYLQSTNFLSIFHNYDEYLESNKKLGFMVENYFFLILKNYFQNISFYRKGNNEFDFIASNDIINTNKYQLFEVKYRNEIQIQDFKFISKQAGKNNLKYYIISKNQLFISENYSIIPIWLIG